VILNASVASSSPALEIIRSSGRSAALRACFARSSVNSSMNVSGGLYAMMRNDVSVWWVVVAVEMMLVVSLCGVSDGGGASAEEGVGCGTMPATMQSNWKTAVISTRSGGRFAVAAFVVVRGRARIRATLI